MTLDRLIVQLTNYKSVSMRILNQWHSNLNCSEKLITFPCTEREGAIEMTQKAVETGATGGRSFRKTAAPSIAPIEQQSTVKTMFTSFPSTRYQVGHYPAPDLLQNWHSSGGACQQVRPAGAQR